MAVVVNDKMRQKHGWKAADETGKIHVKATDFLFLPFNIYKHSSYSKHTSDTEQ